MRVCDRCKKGELDRSLKLTRIHINEETRKDTTSILELCDSCQACFEIMVVNFLGKKNVSSNSITND